VLQLTRDGQRKFVKLTSAVVRAGRQHHRPFHVSIIVNGKLMTRPYIDYHLFPNGLPPDAGIEINTPSKRAARDLAAQLNP
jgi:hypothetical protein